MKSIRPLKTYNANYIKKCSIYCWFSRFVSGALLIKVPRSWLFDIFLLMVLRHGVEWSSKIRIFFDVVNFTVFDYSFHTRRCRWLANSAPIVVLNYDDAVAAFVTRAGQTNLKIWRQFGA